MVIDNLHAARGKQAAHIHTANNGYEKSFIEYSKSFPISHNDFYLRAFVYFSGKQPSDHWTMVAAVGANPSNHADTIFWRYGGQFGQLIANYYDQENDAPLHSKTTLPMGQWVCLEWHFEGDKNRSSMALNDQILADMTVDALALQATAGKGAWLAPVFQKIALGFEIYSNSNEAGITGYDLWLDSVAMDIKPIGCQN